MTIEDLRGFFGQTPADSLGPWDYTLFILFVATSAGVGFYFGLFRAKNNVTDYLYAVNQINYIPIAMSLMVSVISPLSIVGLLPEVYYYGCQRIYATILSIPFSIVIVGYNLTPFLYNLEVKTFFEYFYLRYNKTISQITAGLFLIVTLFHLSIIMYIPASFLNYLSGVSTSTITSFAYILCILYTTVGGMKAVVWTDFVEGLIMFCAVIMVIIISACRLTDVDIWDVNMQGQRLDVTFEPKQTVRDTIWEVMLGTTFTRIVFHFGGQNTIQRIKSLETQQLATKTVVCSIIATETFSFVNIFVGLNAYAKYHKCDPIMNKEIEKRSQLYPHFAMQSVGDIPGLTGILVGGLLCGACGTMSGVMNSVSATIYMEFFPKKLMPKKYWLFVVKIIAMVAGIISYFAVYLVGYIGEVFPLFLMAHGVFFGTIFGLFLLGSFVPQSNSTGAAVGSLLSFSIMLYLLLASQIKIYKQHIRPVHLPVSIKGCEKKVKSSCMNCSRQDDFIESEIGGSNEDTGEKSIYNLSQYFYGPLCAILTILIGTIVSYITGPLDLREVPRNLLHPLIHRFLPLRPTATHRASRIYVDDPDEEMDLIRMQHGLGAMLD